MSETQESDGNDEQNVSSVILEESLTSQTDSPTPQEHQERDDDKISLKINFTLTLKQLKSGLRKSKII